MPSQSDPNIPIELCFRCGEPTGRCEEDSLYYHDEGPYCDYCFDLIVEDNNGW